MEDILKGIFEYGGTVIMAVLFIWIFLEDRKNYKEEKNNSAIALNELSKSNNNIAESLNLLKTSLDNTNAKFIQHDERAICKFEQINNKLLIIESEVKKK